MKIITFNTPNSNRSRYKAQALVNGTCLGSVSLGSKAKTIQGKISEDMIEVVISKLKALKCTSIKITE